MITAERQTTSKLIALDEETRVLGYAQTCNPENFLRELTSCARRTHQVRIYEICPPTVDDTDHYYDFEATCLLQRAPGQESQH